MINTWKIKINPTTSICCDGKSFKVIKFFRGKERTFLSYCDLNAFLKMLPGNIVKNGEDIQSITDMLRILLEWNKTIPEILKSIR